MKAVISTTYDDKYLYFLPLVTWCWNRLGVDAICFMPQFVEGENGGDLLKSGKKLVLIEDTIIDNCSGTNIEVKFSAPKHKEATYAQCSRLYAACLDLPEDEILITSDVDMAVFKVPIPDLFVWDKFVILGTDLVPNGQYPVCYCSATVKVWRDTFQINGATYQECLDSLLGHNDCQDYRANRWSVDQEQLFLKISETNRFELPRSNGQNQFAQKRIDRDDTYWRDRLNIDTIDAHLWRDGFSEQNHNNILELMKYMYPFEDFTWIVNYTEAYKKLL